MKPYLFVLPVAAALSMGVPAHDQDGGPAPKIQVMVVGVAHLVSRRDIHNGVFTDDPLSPKRQAQVAEVVSRLAAFHPTKVLVEAQMSDAKKYVAQYNRYLRDDFALPASEIYQFGFRLAKAAGNSAIYPADAWGPGIYDSASTRGKTIDAYLQKNFTRFDVPETDAFEKRSDDLERSGTYLQLLQYLNTDAAIRANAAWYSVVAGAGRSNDQAGTVYVSQWYTRNVFIFANILSVLSPGDRAVVIFGQGHEYLLREFVRLNPNLKSVDPLEYLH